jgi:uncharacterized membrane protein
MLLLDIATFLGRLHPLVVHLPIGFLLLAAIFDLLSYAEKLKHLDQAVVVILLFGFLSAVVACIFGYLLSLSGEYDYTTLSNHKISGIALAVLSGILYLMSTRSFRKYVRSAPSIVSFSFSLLVILMVYAGHQGSSLTHGSEYLALTTLNEQKREKPASVEEALIFDDVIQPMLQKRCAQCHNAGKLKGKLSVKTLADLIKGGKTGPSIVAGNLEQSELYRRITLDPEHKEFMPKEGKTPLTKNETEIIRWWIEKAMAVDGKKLAELADHESIEPNVASFLGMPGAEIVQETSFTPLPDVNPDIPLTLNSALIENLRNKGLMVRLMLHKPVMLDVTLPAKSGIKMNTIKEELKAVAPHIVWLNVSDNGLTEKDLDFLHLCVNVEKMRLEKNPITDGITEQLVELPHLEVVNLNETGVSDDGMDKLKKTGTIKRLYFWKKVK